MNRATNTAVRLMAECFKPRGPVAEIGSYYEPASEAISNLRPYFPGEQFIGCDIRPGPGVDRIEDANHLSFGDSSVGAVLMLHLLEHLPTPDIALAEAYRILRPDGVLCVGVPFTYRLHGFPSDYWRFTASGLTILLSQFAQRTVFSLGPRLKPTLVFGVAGKEGSEVTFQARSERFRTAVHSTYRSQRLRGYWRELDERARDFLGCLVGRAELSAVFFDPRARSRYVPESTNGESRGDI
jgi:SAM-dependent methyltransferase